MQPLEKKCRKCRKTFLAEQELGGTSPLCHDCDVALHREVDEILRARGHVRPDQKPRWFDEEQR